MKLSSLAVLVALFFTSCAGVRVVRTQTATGATQPHSIYIRPFSVSYAEFAGYQAGHGALIRKSLIPATFADMLQEELAKIAPTRVLAADEYPPQGWLVEGSFDVIKSSHPAYRTVAPNLKDKGQSIVLLHVRITDFGDGPVAEKTVAKVTDEAPTASTDAAAPTDAKPATKTVKTYTGRVVYEFDLAGGSGASGAYGSPYAPGLGDPLPFDLRNAAERIYLSLETDPFLYGKRSAPSAIY